MVVPLALRKWRLARLARRAAVQAYLTERTRHDLAAYEDQIQQFWRLHYGRAIDTTEHLMFAAVSGVEDVRFIPRSVYRDEVLPLLNDLALRPAFLDKNLSDSFLRCDSVPRTIVKRVHGRYFNGSNEPLPRSQVMSRIEGDRSAADTTVIAKPSRTDDGTKISALLLTEAGVCRDGVVQSIHSLEDYFGDNFLVQERVVQDPAVARVHPESVNTLRTITFRWNGQIHHLGTLARFGTDGAINDNLTSGGLFTNVEANGLLGPLAVDQLGRRFSSHPTTGVRFADVQIPNAEAFPRFAAGCHSQVLPFDLIHWDLVVTPGGRPMLLEVNFRGGTGLVQWGLRRGLFGPHTASILRSVAHLHARG